MTLRYNISFILDPWGDKGMARVRCFITWQGTRLRVTTGCAVNISGWDSQLHRCKPRTYHGKSKIPSTHINSKLQDIENAVRQLFEVEAMNDTYPTREAIMEAVDKITETSRKTKPDEVRMNDPKQVIFPVYDLFMRERIHSITDNPNTDSGYFYARKALFDISPTMTFERLSNEGMNLLLNHFANRKARDGEIGLKNTSMIYYFDCIRAFVRWSEANGYTTKNKLSTQRLPLKTVEKTVIFLEWDELMAIYNKTYKHGTQICSVRDAFCLCCFTSLRYSDVKQLKWANISGDKIIITTQKTKDKLTIELNKYSKAILERYDKEKKFDDGLVFHLPVISGVNTYIRRIGKECGIDTPVQTTEMRGRQRVDKVQPKYELLSSHAGRRTFVCNALSLGIPVNVVMEWTGHSSYESMKPYIAIVNPARSSAMRSFDAINPEALISKSPNRPAPKN